MKRIKIVFIILCLSIASSIMLNEYNDHIEREAYNRAQSKIHQDMMSRWYEKQAAQSNKYLPDGSINKDFKDIPELKPEEIKALDDKIRNDEKERAKGAIEFNNFVIGCTCALSIIMFIYLAYLLKRDDSFPKWRQSISIKLRPFSIIIVCALTVVIYQIIVMNIADPHGYGSINGDIYDLFYDSKIAMIIFCLSYILRLPIFICALIALILGSIFTDSWYTTCIQYLVLEIIAYYLSKVIIPFLGTKAFDSRDCGKIKRYFHINGLPVGEDRKTTGKDEDVAYGGNKIDEEDYQQPITIDDLPKLKNMVDSGIITQEEFDSAKKKILG